MKNVERLEVLPLDKLRVDGSYQKVEYERLVDKIVKNFDPTILGELTVSKRVDGFYYLIDGQHRCAAMKIKGFKTARCIVHEGLSVEEEAYRYVGLANRKKQTPNEIIKGDLRIGKLYAVEINSIVTKNGLQICFDRRGRGIRCGATLKSMHKKFGPPVLDEALQLIVKISQGNEDAFVKHIISGFCIFVAEFGDLADRKKLIKKIVTVGFQAFNAKASYYATTQGDDRGVREAILYYYNYHSSKNRLG